MTTILIVEDDETYQCLLHDRLVEKGFRVSMARRGAEALAHLRQNVPDILITDLNLPDMPGTQILETALTEAPDVIALVITGHASVDSSLEALRLGAEDYLPKPLNLDHLDLVISRGIERRRIRLENRELAFTSGLTSGSHGLVGVSKAMQEVYREITRASKTFSTVLILGETGSGKELAARAIHAASPRKKNPFLAVNCGSISGSLLESELFGHIKGAFTGATGNKAGYFEAANGGTLLLDEIQSAPPSVQAALLRVLDRHEVVPVGGCVPIQIDVRIIVTCNRDLDALIANKEFREDLYYRILERSITMPPLRERREDIPLLVETFSAMAELPLHNEPRRFSPKAMAALVHHNWLGNVRQLRNAVIRIVQDAPRPVIRPGNLPSIFTSEKSGSSSKTLAEMERQWVLNAMISANGNKTEAAQMLGLSRSSLYLLLNKHDVPLKDCISIP